MMENNISFIIEIHKSYNNNNIYVEYEEIIYKDFNNGLPSITDTDIIEFNNINNEYICESTMLSDLLVKHLCNTNVVFIKNATLVSTNTITPYKKYILKLTTTFLLTLV